jgi:ribosomal-protein-alanine N-acetyltransferase
MRARGIATEVIRLLTDWTLETLALGRVHVFVATENAPALRVAERAGFEQEGLLRSYWEIDGARVDVIVLSRLPEHEGR